MLNTPLPFETESVQTVLGTRCRTILSGAMTDGALAVVYVEVDEAGVGVPEHVHALEDETFHVLQGRVRVTLEGKQTVLGPGQTMVGPRGRAHAWLALEPSTMVVSATPSGIEEMFAELDALGEAQRDPENVVAVCERYAIRFC